ncbi:MAG TPA: M28 family metallopeptidase [Cyclobacteriaceae bacterium]|nr:M28 family metallopeptidase [Cyclobacteriaceae bacterium]
MKKLFLLFSISSLLFACSSEPKYDPQDGLDALTAEGFEGYLRTLSSDEFQGRMPFTEGETKTIAYLQDEIKKIGLEPGNGDSYIQEVPMVEITTTTDTLLKVSGGKKDFTLSGFKDYVIWTPDPEQPEIKLANEELVFAGYGVVAPEKNWNDYAGVDVKGKIVLVMVNDPDFGTTDSTFKGNAMTYYGRWTYKFEEAARQGAKGCVIVHDDVPAGYGFWVVQNSWNTSKLYLDNRGKNIPVCSAVGWVSLPAAKKLFDAAGINYAEAVSRSKKQGFKPEPMNLKLSTNLKVATKYSKSNNVIAKITGSTQPDEYLVYSTHWDHLGIGKADEKGDSIYNGAHDNASGSAGQLEIAKAFTKLKNKPARTVVFLWVTAEEQGLWGSAYYAQNPVYPKEKTVANINIDGINPYGKNKDIVLVGMGQSDLEDYLNEEAKRVDRYVSPEPNPVAGYYFRSDHFNFAKVGIPALYTNIGIDNVEKGAEYGKQLQDDYVAKHYHKPSDEFTPELWKTDGAIDDLKLLFKVGKRISMEKTWPQWKESSEFKPIRDSYMKK